MAAGGVADAKVEVQDAHLKLSDEDRRKLQSLQTPDDVVIVEDGHPIDRAQAKKLKALARRGAPPSPLKETTPKGVESAAPAVLLWKQITIAVTAPDKLWVNGAGAAMELGLAPDFRIVIAEETRVHGEVIVRRGRVDALGRRFDLKADSSLQFEGGTGPPHAGRHGAVPGQRRQRHRGGDRQGSDRSPDDRGQFSEPPRPESIAALRPDHHRPPAGERRAAAAAWAPPPRTKQPR